MDTDLHSPLERAAAVLTCLPAGTRVTFVTPQREHQGEARDYPWTRYGHDDGRRYTVGGSEWFITAAALERLGVTSIKIDRTTLDRLVP
jgi:hypothetical protein